MLKLIHETPPRAFAAVDADTLVQAGEIIEWVKRGDLRALAERWDAVPEGESLLVSREAQAAAWASLDPEDRAALQRAAERISAFAKAQRASCQDVEIEIPGGRAGHRVTPVARAGCYAPGGRYPLPSSVLMTALTARAAGVSEVWLVSPRPSAATLAAAHLAGVDGFLRIGGAQAIAAMAYGVEMPPVDVIVGPGNRFVTAAKQLVFGQVGIDMLAGPSELVVLAGEGASAEVIAADLIAQAEHDDDAVPILVTTSASLAHAVNVAILKQLADLPTRVTAERAFQNGYALVCTTENDAIEAVNKIAPEHLEVMSPFSVEGLANFGGLFLGESCAEVFGDYGAGPNHTLPTGGTARYAAGLSVFAFLRMQTWMSVDNADQELIKDTARLARMEGLEGHARAAEQRAK